MATVAAAVITAGMTYVIASEQQKDARKARKDDRRERRALEGEMASRERVASEGADMAARRRQQQMAASQNDKTEGGTVLAGGADAGYKTDLGE